MRVTKLVAALWMASAAIFGIGIFLAAQSAIGPQDAAQARVAETDLALKYRKVIRQTDAREPQVKELVAAKTPSPEAMPATLSDRHEPMPLPALKKGGPEKWVGVVGTEAILRPEPADAAPMIVAFPVARILFVQGEREGWIKVQDPKTATTGWIKADQLATPDEMRMARLERREGAAPDKEPAVSKGPAVNKGSAVSKGPAMEQSNSARGDERSMEGRATASVNLRSERRPRGPLGGLLRRALGR